MQLLQVDSPVARPFWESPPSPESQSEHASSDYAQAALFLAHLHLDRHCALKLVNGSASHPTAF